LRTSSEELAEFVSRHSEVVENRFQRAGRYRPPGVYGNARFSITALQSNMRAAPANLDPSRIPQRAQKPVTRNDR